MKTKPVSQTVGPWLKENLGPCLGGLIGQDWAALRTAVHAAELWTFADNEGRTQAAIAFNACVHAMQPKLRYLAFHSIAHVGDWSHRAKFWHEANLAPLENIGRCKHE